MATLIPGFTAEASAYRSKHQYASSLVPDRLERGGSGVMASGVSCQSDDGKYSCSCRSKCCKGNNWCNCDDRC